ncbi:hypothetical protein HYH70_15690 [Clostridium botulinum]|uniref:DUF7210 family protein n=1 Tax=Clostridium botulinum TaxID=1491 RepID=UPI00035BB180|nr:hypothetical protein [Clostridium botulinum]EPS47732.1 hypothetical protein CFSAN002367_22795 [Clostridium botulinum CFSAN002367]KON10096.1 hypothetical protein ACP52_08120 [Clostridium botulinum]MBY6907026.1 hypothetical protein [Clostridium botulinum]MBY6928540.1 hypothetical protein [Clostridium botulinum]MBY6956135.1 hypothetical protein [Clostridium botulinum]
MANKKTVKAKALVNLKYDKDCFKIGNELKVRIEDALDMIEKEHIELLEELPEENQEEEIGESAKEGE